MKSVFLKISGQVQGVLFRVHAGAKANELGIIGWVRNTNNGAVEIMAESDEIQLKIFLDWCYNKNNKISFAKVRQVDVKWGEATGKFNKFDIKYT